MLYVDHEVEKVPLLEEFRRFFYDSYSLPLSLAREASLPGSRGSPVAGVTAGSRRRHLCSPLHITLLWRRDYLAHPRNPQGSVSRKIANEAALADHLKLKFPQAKITDVQLDLYSIKDQVFIYSLLSMCTACLFIVY